MTPTSPLYRIGSTGMRSRNKKSIPHAHQRGVTLVELMVGLAIGLLVIAVAMGALMVSRGITGTVSDAATIQQQAAYAMRVMGQQLRQAGSLYLDLGLTEEGEGDVAQVSSLRLLTADAQTLQTDGQKMTVTYTGYKEPNFANIESSLSRDCLGNPPTSFDENNMGALPSKFELSTDQLRCNNQPIIRNVADFQIRYLEQDQSIPGQPTIQYLNGSDIDATNWPKIQAVEICLVLFGDEPIDIPSDSTYKGCDSTDKTYTNKRMHLLFRNVFQLRSQGLVAGGL